MSEDYSPYSITDGPLKTVIIRHIREIDLEALGKVAKEIRKQQEEKRRLQQICRVIPKTW